MGMDVYGKAPTTRVGDYFRSTVWTWPTVIEAIASVEVLPPEMVEQMCYNVGAGPDQEQAIALADALEAKYGSMPADGVFITEGDVTNTGTALIAQAIREQLAPLSDNELPEFSADVQFILEFARFSRDSGGFQVL